MVLTGSFELSPVIGLCCHRRQPRCESIVAGLTSASRCQDHTTSPSALRRVRRSRQSVHRLPRPTFCDDRETPLRRARDGRKSAFDLPDVTSKNACGTLARRANQPRSGNSCQVAGNCCALVIPGLRLVAAWRRILGCRRKTPRQGAKSGLPQLQRIDYRKW